MNVLGFIRNWTLPVAIATGIVLYSIFAFVPALEEASLFFEPLCAWMLPVFMFLVLYVTFCKVNFHKMKPVRWHLWIGIFQVFFVLIIVGSILTFSIKGNNLILLEAILTCIICPCASACAVVTQKLGGSIEESTSYTFLSNFITAALIPICFPMIETAAGITFLSSFLTILKEVVIVLIMPMLCAYITKHYIPALHRKVTGVKDLAYYLWGGSLVIVSGTTMRNICHADTSVLFLAMVALLGLVLCLVQFAVGRYIGHFFDRTVEAGQGLGQKNTAFAIWIASAYLNPLSTVGPGCYILWQNIINSIEIWRERTKSKSFVSSSEKNV